MDYQKIVNNILADNGFEQEVPVSVNERLSSTLGRACFTRNRSTGLWRVVRIELSKSLLRTAKEEDVINIIKHECAHVIIQHGATQDYGHSKKFKEVCARLNCPFDEPACAPQIANYDNFKYVLECKSCGHKDGFARKREFFDMIKFCICPSCGVLGSLSIKQNW